MSYHSLGFDFSASGEVVCDSSGCHAAGSGASVPSSPGGQSNVPAGNAGLQCGAGEYVLWLGDKPSFGQIGTHYYPSCAKSCPPGTISPALGICLPAVLFPGMPAPTSPFQVKRTTTFQAEQADTATITSFQLGPIEEGEAATEEEKDHTLLYIGLGLGVLGLIALATRKKRGRR